MAGIKPNVGFSLKVQEQMLYALKLTYRKHHLGDDSVGWDELSHYLRDALCETMGDHKFIAWSRAISEEP